MEKSYEKNDTCPYVFDSIASRDPLEDNPSTSETNKERNNIIFVNQSISNQMGNVWVYTQLKDNLVNSRQIEYIVSVFIFYQVISNLSL